MSDTLQIFGKTYEGVTGLVAKDSGGVDVIYTAGSSARISPAKTVNPSENQQIILPDEIYPPTRTPDASVPTGTSGNMSGTQLCHWDFKPSGWGIVGQQYYINAEFTAVDNTKVVIDGCVTYTSNYCGDGHGGCYLTPITTITGASTSLIQGTEWWTGGIKEQIYIDGYESSDLTSLNFTTSKELKIYSAPFEREDGIAQVTVNGAPLQSKTVTPSSSQQIITPDSSRIFTAPVGTVLNNFANDIFEIPNMPSPSAYSNCYFKGQITVSNGTIIDINGVATNKGYFLLNDIVTITGSMTLNGVLWLSTDILIQFENIVSDLTATVTQEFTIDTINPLCVIASGSAVYNYNGNEWRISLPSGINNTEYYMQGKIQFPDVNNTSVYLTINGNVTYTNDQADLTAISSITGASIYDAKWKGIAYSDGYLNFELNYSSTADASVISPLFIVPTPVTENYYGLSSVTVEAMPSIYINGTTLVVPSGFINIS